MNDYLTLAEDFGLGIEFGDFCHPSVLAEPEEYARRLDFARERLVPLNLKRTLHTPFKGINPHSVDNNVRKKSRDMIKESLETAMILQCSLVVVHSAYDERNDNPEELDRAAEDFIPFLEQLLDQSNLLICLENIHDRDTAFLDRIAHAIDNPRLGFCMDVGHMSAFGKLPFETWYDHFGERTLHNHWHDNAGEKDAHGALGSGSIDWEKIVRLHERNCPQSTIALEIPHEAGIRQSLELLRPFLLPQTLLQKPD
jgi:sugar phosphate isomerase/epimerase